MTMIACTVINRLPILLGEIPLSSTSRPENFDSPTLAENLMQYRPEDHSHDMYQWIAGFPEAGAGAPLVTNPKVSPGGIACEMAVVRTMLLLRYLWPCNKPCLASIGGRTTEIIVLASSNHLNFCFTIIVIFVYLMQNLRSAMGGEWFSEWFLTSLIMGWF